MGGGNSVQAIQKSITNNTASIITESMQKASSLAYNEQRVVVTCNAGLEIMTKALAACHELHKDRPYTQIVELCAPYNLKEWRCGINGLEMTTRLNVQLTGEQMNNVEAAVSNDLKSNLSTALQQDMGLLEFGKTTKVKMNAFIDVTTKIFNESIQLIYESMQNVQTVELEGGTLQNVTMDSATESVNDWLMSNSAYLQASNDLAVSIDTDLKNQQSKNTLIIVAIVVGALIVLAIIVAVVYIVSRSKKGSKEGFNIKIEPNV